MAEAPCEYMELHGSPTDESVDMEKPNSYTCKAQYLCNWADRYDLGGWFLTGDNGLPIKFPHHTGSTNVRARRLSVKPFDAEQLGSGTIASYQYAILEVDYGIPSFEKGAASELYSESIEPAAEFLTLDNELFAWSDGEELKENEAPGRLFITCDYVLSRYGLTSLPSAVFSLIGCVNNAQFVSPTLGWTFAAQTLLFNPPTASRKVSTEFESLVWDITIRMTYNPNTWNKFWRADTQQWETIKIIGGSTYNNYTPANFGALLPT